MILGSLGCHSKLSAFLSRRQELHLIPIACCVWALSLALGKGTRGPFWYFLLLLPLLPAISYPGHYFLLFFAQFLKLQETAHDCIVSEIAS